MGIVVTLCMLLGIIALLNLASFNVRTITVSAAILGAGGLWNAAWYGLQNLNQFWGQAALVTGLIMVAAAAYLLAQRANSIHEVETSPSSPVKVGLLIALSLCLLLYAVTLVQLNLGLQIIA